MKKKFLILLFLFFPFFVFAYSKDDIYKLIEKEKMCEKEETIYDEYLNKYIKSIKSKDLNDGDINFIYKNISNILNEIKKNNICTFEELSKLDKKEQEKIVKSLKDILERINSSKYLNNLYDNGEYLDENSRNEFNYVGVSKDVVNIKYILIGCTLIIFIFLILSKKKILNEILTIIFVLILFFDLIYYIYLKNPIDLNVLTLINYQSSFDNDIKVVNKSVENYPSFASLIGNLKIDSLNINIPIFYGESTDIYEIGLSHIYSFPGFNGRTIISGHNNILNDLQNITFNSKIKIETNYGIFNYSVYKIEVLNEDEFKKMDDKNKILIIYTCYPFNEIKYSNKRYIVYAYLDNEEWFND